LRVYYPISATTLPGDRKAGRRGATKITASADGKVDASQASTLRRVIEVLDAGMRGHKLDHNVESDIDCSTRRWSLTMADIRTYAARIHDDDDRPLFEDAVKAAEAGALRGAYVLIWISCAESIKRRFREAEKRDSAAGKIVGELEQKEKDHKSVDKFVLDKAKEYGFITDTAYTILLNIYEMRCVYGHPYEQAPLPEQVSHAAAMVVEHVLSQAVRLRHGYGQTLLNSLLQDKYFLDDQKGVVEKFAREIALKIDDRIYGWFLDTYWKELEKIADDASQVLYFRRGIYFCRSMAAISAHLFTHDDWHVAVGKYPKILACVVLGKPFFASLGERAQDSLIGFAIDRATERASTLQYIDWLMEGLELSDRQKYRFLKCIDDMELADLRAAKLSLGVCLNRLIAELKSHNWYKQQPAINMIVEYGLEEIARLGTNDQVTLGRNILQVADGGERSSKRLLQKIGEAPHFWPENFIAGIAIECFANESEQVRLKCDRLESVMRIVDGLDKPVRCRLVEKIEKAILGGQPKESNCFEQEFRTICTNLGASSWASSIKQAVESRKSELVMDFEDDE
jgi:hypothetical protein